MQKFNSFSIQVVRIEEPGESRNCGIRNAKMNFLAFLDADDYYCENRFRDISELLGDATVDGTYSVVGVQYLSDNVREKHLVRMMRHKANIKKPSLPVDHTGVESIVASQDLFYHLLRTDLGWIHLNGLTIKTKALRGFKLFNQNYLGQDSEFITRLSAEKRLVGSKDAIPVAIRVVHDNNRILASGSQPVKQSIGHQYWLKYCLDNRKIGKEHIYLLLRQCDSSHIIVKCFKLALNIFIGLLFTLGLKKINFV